LPSGCARLRASAIVILPSACQVDQHHGIFIGS